jgi:hypothetical protein
MPGGRVLAFHGVAFPSRPRVPQAAAPCLADAPQSGWRTGPRGPAAGWLPTPGLALSLYQLLADVGNICRCRQRHRRSATWHDDHHVVAGQA